VAATVLTRAAVDRGSRDNVTVVIVDLSPMTQAEVEAEAQLSEVGGRSEGWAAAALPCPPSLQEEAREAELPLVGLLPLFCAIPAPHVCFTACPAAL
jgi:hypothetical protein